MVIKSRRILFSWPHRFYDTQEKLLNDRMEAAEVGEVRCERRGGERLPPCELRLCVGDETSRTELRTVLLKEKGASVALRIFLEE